MRNLNRILAFSAMAAITFSSCKKDDDNDDDDDSTATTTTCTIDKYASSSTSGWTENADYIYSSDKLVRVNYTDSSGTLTSFVKVTYSGDNIATIEEFNASDSSAAEVTFTYTYTGSDITQIKEDWDDNGTPASGTHTLTYANGVLATWTTSGSVDEGIQGLKNPTVTSGNLTKAELLITNEPAPIGEVWAKMTVIYDSKKNLGRLDLPTPENMILKLNANNAIMGTLDEDVVVAGTTIMAAGDTLFGPVTLTYDSNNEVKTTSETNDDGSTETVTYTITCVTK